MIIDNFDIIRSHLDFIDKNLDRYVIHILRRVKDISEDMKNALGSRESQRLIKTYYIDSIDYFDRKKEAIKELCRSNNARAYIIVQPKDNFECLINLGQKIFETIRLNNYSVKPEHLIRQAYCGSHKTRKKQWVLDLDHDEMHGWTVKEVKNLVIEELRKIQEFQTKKDPVKYATWLEDSVYEVPTKHGIHLITPPFNLQSAQEKCAMLFEGSRKGHTLEDSISFLHLNDSINDVKRKFNKHEINPFNIGEYVIRSYFGTDYFPIKYSFQDKLIERPGWLHKDGMTLLYMEDKD